jgi:hypothetical protein
MLFAYAVRGVYIESCAMFVRGGVYRVVKEAMGGTLAKLSVSALMFDYVLDRPHQRRLGGPVHRRPANELLASFTCRSQFRPPRIDGDRDRDHALLLAPERPRIEESSDKAMKIMGITTVMLVVMFVWCGVTLWLRGAKLPPLALHFNDESWAGWPVRVGRRSVRSAC